MGGTMYARGSIFHVQIIETDVIRDLTDNRA